MSVAIDASATAQFDKNAYDAEFDVTESDEEEYLGPAKMCWFTCLLTGI